ncbi:hypothetical protein Ethha_0554 [Ethanoligenens harbinense YUAN-3]|uniref:Uncharacterized protein n=2 Tax=Ethanoligenens harbinense TaxID=253239 RepID=E6U9E0_ETHHY|nr:hypothetical protein Ethha_0554 [Ethanoligenens harbinense YUAN-3]
MVLLGIFVYFIFAILGILLYFNGKDVPSDLPKSDTPDIAATEKINR